ncbi:MAG: carboxypeptidase regulatory-like domain-containing protein [Bradymonadaceae bacterium]
MRRTLIAAAVLGAILAVGLPLCRDDSTPDESSSQSAPSEQNSESSEDDFVPYRRWVFRRGEYALHFVHPGTGRGVPVAVTVGAPGLWPPRVEYSDARGLLFTRSLDLETFGGEDILTREVIARSRARSLATWRRLELGPDAASSRGQIVRLQPATPVRVRVLDPDGNPLAGARLHLTREALSLAGLAARSNSRGRHVFAAIPPGRYVIRASARGLEGRTRVSHDASAASSVTIQTSESTTETSAPTPPDTEPRPVRVELRGLTPEQWRRVTVLWRRGQQSWRAATLTEGASEGERVWSGRLPQGQYGLRAQTRSGAHDTTGFQVDEGGIEFTWDVSLSVEFDVYAVDPYGTPVDGALLQLWRDGRLRETALSRGGEPVAFDFAVGEKHRLIAFDGRLGEGERRIEPTLDATGGRDVTVTLDQKPFSASRPPNRLRAPPAIEKALGADLTQIRDRWLVDRIEEGSPAERGELQRGDRVLSVHRSAGRLRVLVERNDRIFEVGLGRQ